MYWFLGRSAVISARVRPGITFNDEPIIQPLMIWMGGLKGPSPPEIDCGENSNSQNPDVK